MDALDPALEVIRFDVPGVGGSPLPVRPYRFTGLCRLVAQMLTALGYDGAVDVLGISWGGGVAQHFAVQRAAVPAAGAGQHRDRRAHGAGPAARAGPDDHPAALPGPRVPAEVAPQLYGGTAAPRPGGVAAMMHAHSRVGSPRGYLYQLTAGLGWTSLPFLPLLRQPTLILSGDDDPLIPLANARLMRRLIPNSRLHVYHGGHLGLVTEAASSHRSSTGS